MTGAKVTLFQYVGSPPQTLVKRYAFACFDPSDAHPSLHLEEIPLDPGQVKYGGGFSVVMRSVEKLFEDQLH